MLNLILCSFSSLPPYQTMAPVGIRFLMSNRHQVNSFINEYLKIKCHLSSSTHWMHLRSSEEFFCRWKGQFTGRAKKRKTRRICRTRPVAMSTTSAWVISTAGTKPGRTAQAALTPSAALVPPAAVEVKAQATIVAIIYLENINSCNNVSGLW